MDRPISGGADGRKSGEGDCADTAHDQELKALRKELDEGTAERDCARRETARKDEALQQMRSACESKDRELAALRLQVRGVEVHDVDAGVRLIEDRGDAEPPAKRVRREQDARMRVCEMYQARLVEVKKEREEEGERRQSTMRSTIDAKVKEKVAQVGACV